MNLIVLLGSFFITGVSLFVLKPVAEKIGLIDIPGGHKTHISATPLVGGLGIYLGILVTSIFTTGALAQFAPFLSLSALVLFIGTIDDAKELTVIARMTGHALVALVMAVVAGIQLTSLGDLIYLGPLELGSLTIPFTIFATVGVINAVNMADGLSGGLVIVALFFVGVLSFIAGDILQASFVAMIICSIIAFLSLNFRRPWNKKALIYLGDAGSTMLGFMLAWFFISGTQGQVLLFEPVYALWFLMLPLFDTVNLLIKRPLKGISPFTPGTDHLHHLLLKRGFSVEAVVAIMTSLAFLLGIIGFLGHYYEANESFMFQVFISLFIIYFLYSDKIDPVNAKEHTDSFVK
jgi:UDP-GlcNAc:undecaprenyl-phosphate/decaprenyl-phosphate GlcNAc-1-phosphate transferase